MPGPGCSNPGMPDDSEPVAQSAEKYAFPDRSLARTRPAGPGPALLEQISALFRDKGDRAYAGEPVSQIEHALQTAALADADGASEELVAAALLHDLGHLVNDQGETPTGRGIDDRHQYAALGLLRRQLPDAVLDPIRLHVDAKRYLCATDPRYLSLLSADSVRSLALQGGTFTAAEARRFIEQPHAADSVRLRRWDDLAKVAGAVTPSLEHFLQRIARLPC
jgi:phosphonate degradation associated HDIG domain protein